MKVIKKAKRIQPVDNWRLWYKKWSTWIVAAIPVITVAREAFPALVDVIPLETYKMIMAALAFASIVAIQIKQRSISVPPKEEDNP